MLSIFLFIAEVIAILDLSVILTYSDETPEPLLEQFSSFTLKYKISSQSHFTDLLKFSDSKELLIVDISSHQIFFSFLDQISEYLDTIYLTLTESDGSTFSKYRYSAHLSSESQVNTLLNLTDYLGWSKFTVFSSLKPSDYKMATYMKTMTTQKEVSYNYYDINLSDNLADLLVKRNIKILGVRNLLLIDSSQSLGAFLKTLEKRKVFREGFYLVLSSKGIYSKKIDGTLIVSEPGTEASVSESNYDYLRIRSILDKIPLNIDFKVFIKNLCGSSDLCKHSLVNIQGSYGKTVGFISNSVNVTDSILFPGNSTSIEPSGKNSKIRFSIANGTSELYHQGYNPIFSYFYMGAGFAVTRSNIYKEIENFDLELFPTDCGNVAYEPNWYKQCFSELMPNMGIAYLTGLWMTGIIGNIMTLRGFDYRIPQISPYGQDTGLENKTTYPEFITLTVSENEFYSTATYFLSSANWKTVNLMVTDEPASLVGYEKLKNFLIKSKITIANPLNYQVFPSNYTRDDFDQYKSHFLPAKNTLCRIYFITSRNTQPILEGLYDIGLRKGDFIGIFNIPYLSLINNSDIYQYKIKELLDGSLAQTYKEYVGEYGKTVLEEIRRYTNSTQNLCFSFDTVSILKNSISHLMAIGEDYEDPEVLNNYIRIQKTTGCLGSLKIDADKNTRSSFTLALDQIYFVDGNTDFLYREAILVNKFSSNPIYINDEIEWPGGSKSIPKNFFEYNSCGLDDRTIKTSDSGKNAFLVLSGIIITISIIPAIISAFIYSNVLPPIEENTIITINDKFFLAFFVCEFFQISLNGNRKGLIYEIALKLFLAFGLDLVNFFQYQGESFWDLIIVLVCIELFFCILCAVEVFFSKRILEKLYLLGKIQDLSEILLPVLGHIGFLPLISMTLNVFVCKEAISDALEDSFAEFDCKMFCYKGKHKKIAIVSLISIASYLIPAIILRPYWEMKNLNLNIRTKPLYLAVLSVTQVTLTLVHNIFKFENTYLLGYINSAIVGFLLVFTLLYKPFNYERAGIFQLTALLLCFWDILLGCVINSYNSIEWKILHAGGLVITIIVGIFLSGKLPKKFDSEVDFPISNLILFQFRKNPNRFLRTSKNIDLAEFNQINLQNQK